MLLSLSLMIVVGFILGEGFKLLKLPYIIGYLMAGILLGPFGFDLLSELMLEIRPDLRQMALVIILLRAGLSLDINDLKKTGRPALLMAFIPSLLEIIGVILLAPLLLGFNYVDAFILATILAAVSPAIVVPRMIKMINAKDEKQKKIGQMVMAGASLDDIFVIVLFTLGIEISKTRVFNLSSLFFYIFRALFNLFGVIKSFIMFIYLLFLFDIKTASFVFLGFLLQALTSLLDLVVAIVVIPINAYKTSINMYQIGLSRSLLKKYR